MATRKLYPLAVLSLVIALVLVSCQSVQPQVTTPVAAEETPNAFDTAVAQTLTAAPTETFTPAPTKTPKPSATITSTPTRAASPTPAAVGPNDFPENVNPLTGLTVSDPDILNRRPVIIKVANFPAEGRPHAGLSNADIVFDYWIGYGANRFAALYYGQDSEQVGPIRSARLVDAQLGVLYQAIVGFESGYITVTNKVYNALGNRAVSGSPSTCPAICDDGRGLVTSHFANTSAFNDLAKTLGINNDRPNLDGMYFDMRVPAGQTATDVMVQFNYYNRGEWRYDAASGKYLRWIEQLDASNNISMIPLVDRNNEEQLAFDNVVILYAFYTEFAPALHDIELQGQTAGRKAVLFRDGKAIEGTWKVASNAAPIQFFTSDGQPMPFKPGNSWFVLTGTNSGMLAADGNWTLNFVLP